MSRIAIVAEKPSVGRDIARVLNCSRKGNGFIAGDGYIITWAIGHLACLFEPEDYAPSLKRWNFSTLPILPQQMKLKTVSTAADQFEVVREIINSDETDSLICATDSGREGELIFRYIYELADCKKPFRRLWISSMTDEAIKAGFASLQDGGVYDTLYASAKCRSEADWLVGINASRAFSIRYNANLSVGRVQTPTLAILVQRQQEIENFVVQQYYEVKADYGDFSGIWFTGENRETKISDRDRAKAIAEKVKGTEGFVLEVEEEQKQTPPPLLYDLTELQRDCNKKYGFSADKTLSLAQDLYEKRKLLTYPRTDSRYLSDDMIPQLRQILSRVSFAPYDKFIAPLMESELPLSKRIVDGSKVTDHHAIIPTNTRHYIENLSADEKAVYDLVVRRFISVFYPYHLYTITRIISQSREENFISKGKTVTQMGWMEVSGLEENSSKGKGKGKKKNDEEEQLLPALSKGDALFFRDAEVLHKKTKPPANYTEAALLSAMENAGRFVEDEELKEQLKESGLGTPATRAGIIERLIAVQYIERKGKSLIPTEKGRRLIEIVPQELKSPETTGKWEKGLSSISKGGLLSERFMGSIVRYVRFIVEYCAKNKADVLFPQEVSGKLASMENFGACPVCGNGVILENRRSFYCSSWRAGCRFSIWKDSLENREITHEMVRSLLKEGAFEQDGGIIVFAEPVTGKLLLRRSAPQS